MLSKMHISALSLEREDSDERVALRPRCSFNKPRNGAHYFLRLLSKEDQRLQDEWRECRKHFTSNKDSDVIYRKEIREVMKQIDCLLHKKFPQFTKNCLEALSVNRLPYGINLVDIKIRWQLLSKEIAKTDALIGEIKRKLFKPPSEIRSRYSQWKNTVSKGAAGHTRSAARRTQSTGRTQSRQRIAMSQHRSVSLSNIKSNKPATGLTLQLAKNTATNRSHSHQYLRKVASEKLATTSAVCERRLNISKSANGLMPSAKTLSKSQNTTRSKFLRKFGKIDVKARKAAVLPKYVDAATVTSCILDCVAAKSQRNVATNTEKPPTSPACQRKSAPSNRLPSTHAKHKPIFSFKKTLSVGFALQNVAPSDDSSDECVNLPGSSKHQTNTKHKDFNDIAPQRFTDSDSDELSYDGKFFLSILKQQRTKLRHIIAQIECRRDYIEAHAVRLKRELPILKTALSESRSLLSRKCMRFEMLCLQNIKWSHNVSPKHLYSCWKRLQDRIDHVKNLLRNLNV